MGYRLAALITIALFAGVFLAGQGLSGLVVSQSCCFGPSCAAENLCNLGNEKINFSYIGLALMLSGAVFYISLKYIH